MLRVGTQVEEQLRAFSLRVRGALGMLLSDGGKDTVADAMSVIFQLDWKKVFDAEQLLLSTRKITEIK